MAARTNRRFPRGCDNGTRLRRVRADEGIGPYGVSSGLFAGADCISARRPLGRFAARTRNARPYGTQNHPTLVGILRHLSGASRQLPSRGAFVRAPTALRTIQRWRDRGLGTGGHTGRPYGAATRARRESPPIGRAMRAPTAAWAADNWLEKTNFFPKALDTRPGQWYIDCCKEVSDG